MGGLDPGFVRKQLMTFVKDVMASDDELELDSPFMEAGMDSLSSVSLMSMATDSKKLAAAVHDRRAETEAQLMITQVLIAMNADRDVPEKGAHPLDKALRSATDAVSLSGKTGDR